MPIQVASNIIPRNGAKWHVVEDIYVKGGLRVVADATVRDAIYADVTAKLTLKVGMLLVTADDKKLWQYKGNGVWDEFRAGGATFSHTVADPATEWLVPHNKNSRQFTYCVFDTDGKQLLPDECTIIDDNNLKLSFLEAISGTVSLTFV